MANYESQAARDASALYSSSYCEYLDAHAKEMRDYCLRNGDTDGAEKMMTRSLSEALMGNDGN